MEENKNIQNEKVNVIKKRTFTESEQNTGSYNVGLKKSSNNISQKQKQQILNHLNDINPDIKLETMSQEQLLTAKATNNKRPNNNKLGNKVKLVFLGGVGEIGKNITAVEYGDDIVIIDCGLAFPSEDMPGVDLVIPDFSYLEKNKEI